MTYPKKKKTTSVVAIGGGTGLPNVLKSLKIYTEDITAIVTVADDGGSSGRIRQELGILPPGDIRNCLMALADSRPVVDDIFQYRFKEGELAGHSLGNLILAALTDIKGDFIEALRELSDLLKIKGKVLPSSIDDIVLLAKAENGKLIKGQSRITGPRNRGGIKNVRIEPEDAEAYSEALEAIKAANQIIIGPGSLFTSIIPNLLIRGIREAMAKSGAMKIFICNIVTQSGETDNYSTADHLEAILRHVPENFVDVMIANSNFDNFVEHGLTSVDIDKERVLKLGTKLLLEDVVDSYTVGHHDPYKLGQVLRALI